MTGQVAEAEKELIMALSQAYLEWEQQTEQRGVQQGAQQDARLLILRLLNRHGGIVSKSLETQINSLSLNKTESLVSALSDFKNLSDISL
jgi:hypothetical protein